MKKLLFISTAFLLITTFASCRKEKLDPNLPVNWKHSKVTPTGCSEPAPGSAAYYVIFSQHKYSFPQMYSVWMTGGVPAITTGGQMLFGASITLTIGVAPWNQIVDYFAANKQAEYVVVRHLIDGGPSNEDWTITTW